MLVSLLLLLSAVAVGVEVADGDFGFLEEAGEAEEAGVK